MLMYVSPYSYLPMNLQARFVSSRTSEGLCCPYRHLPSEPATKAESKAFDSCLILPTTPSGSLSFCLVPTSHETPPLVIPS